MKTKKEYKAPELTVVTFKVEKGYASSNMLTFSMEQDELYNEQCQEKWTEAGSFFESW